MAFSPVFPLFGFRPDMIIGSGRKGYWLQDVVSSASFACVYSSGYASAGYLYAAGGSGSTAGVHPHFLQTLSVR